MFTRKSKWSSRAVGALIFAGMLYKIARLFMKSTEKQTRVKKPKPARK